MPVAEWDFAGRRRSGPLPPDTVAAISAALEAYVAEEPTPSGADPVIPWGLAGRREAVGQAPIASRCDLGWRRADENRTLF